MNSLGSLPVFFLAGLDLLGLHVAAGIGDVDRALDQRRDAHARTAAGDLHIHVRRHLPVLLRPGLGQVDHRVGAFVLDGRLLGGVTAAAAGRSCRNRFAAGRAARAAAAAAVRV